MMDGQDHRTDQRDFASRTRILYSVLVILILNGVRQLEEPQAPAARASPIHVIIFAMHRTLIDSVIGLNGVSLECHPFLTLERTNDMTTGVHPAHPTKSLWNTRLWSGGKRLQMALEHTA